MIYIFAGNMHLATKTALANGLPPKSKNVVLLTPRNLDYFRGRIIYAHDTILWGIFPNGGENQCVEAVAMARR